MIELVQKLTTLLTEASFIGFIVAAVFYFQRDKSKASFFLTIGIVLVEAGRLIRMYGPKVSLSVGDGGWWELSHDTSWPMFLLSMLTFPLGLSLVMATCIYLAIRKYQSE